MNETRIPEISDAMKERIKDIVKYHYGFAPKDDDIAWIDEMLRNNYSALHDQRIIRELAVENVSDELLKHRDRIGSVEFERIWLEKTIFNYLTFASMCYRAGIPAGTISLCRTAIESGLRERLAEQLARKEKLNDAQLPKAVLDKLTKLRDQSLNKLISLAESEKIIMNREIEGIFRGLKFRNQTSRRILDKFIHGDIIWMVNFAKDRGDVKVVGAKDKLEEYKIIAEGGIGQIAFEVLKGTYKIAEILYYKNI